MNAPTRFAWDDAKAESNLAKHGVRFEVAVGVFLDPLRLDGVDTRQDYGEERRNVVAVVDGICLTSPTRCTTTPPGLSPPGLRAGRSADLMATVRRSRTSLEAQPPRFTEEVRANLQAMSEEEIAQRAASDPDNLLLNDSELARLAAIRAVRRARERTGLSQAKFAERYWINPARLRDWEQGRYPPDSVALAYLAVIARDPEAVARALAES